MAQKFMTYEQQLIKLQADKGLTIPDADFARKTLEEITHKEDPWKQAREGYLPMEP